MTTSFIRPAHPKDAAAWAQTKGVPTLRVRSNVVRTETHAFYLHMGFTSVKSQKVFSLSTGFA